MKFAKVANLDHRDASGSHSMHCKTFFFFDLAKGSHENEQLKSEYEWTLRPPQAEQQKRHKNSPNDKREETRVWYLSRSNVELKLSFGLY